ncbi:MAG: exosortase system-associated protein, TIGR04073 family [Candidatus Omnitrophica bacterium]|jgi:putative exosortase-associated protein (TIGR04073 family)|nr:exosortase system-associated protein, TIGR04073 family [Candidatus Omnitrophota bacterium]
MKKMVICALTVSLVLSVMFMPATAQTDDKDKIETVHNNALLGWTEIPKAVAAVTKDSDNPFLGLTIGLWKGVVNAFARTVSGVGDAVTLHNPEYKSAIKPSMVEIPNCNVSK